ncbi:amidohydrolase [Brevibacterium luteolum]|uniref:Amidohydrolase n=1 Tax=Brevibacterium luteolum TaxID=199591 RepID=A0A2N6PJW9_9MICO|nr:amidohydrolase [Brevibacterium luteolum]PMB98992.1 amidohydrolase [Brevibacterium luteolum]
MLLDTIVTGNIITMDSARPRAKRMGIWNGQIVGFDDDLVGLSARDQEAFTDGSIIPGFIDGHTHLATTGMKLQGLDVSSERSVEAVLRCIAEAVTGIEPGEWVEVWGYDQRNIGRHLTPAEIDEAATQTPVVIRHVSSHACVLNTKAIDLLPGADLRAKVTEDGGLVFEKMQDLVRDLVEPYRLSKIEKAVEAAARLSLSEGVTTSIDAGVGTGLTSHSEIDVRGYFNLQQRDALGIRVQLMPCMDYLHPLKTHADDYATAALDLGLQQGFGGDQLWFGPAKMWFDGGMMARSSAFNEPYEGTDFKGELAEDKDVLQNRLIEAHLSGWDVAAHAIGDYAIDCAIEAFEEAQRLAPDKSRRHRIEHGALIREDHIPRLAKLSMSIGTQPCFVTFSGDDFRDIMGPARSQMLYRGRSLINAGVRLIGSTDRPLPGAPLVAMKALMDRKSATGQVVGEGENVTVVEALSAFTVNGAWAARREDRIGTLAAGKYADWTVLSEDLLEAVPETVGDAEVLATYVNGVRRY